MLRFIVILAFIFASIGVQAQQDAQYSLFMLNKLYFNPAYAGGKKVFSLSAIYRKQWIGITGAPQTITINAHAPIWKQRMGLGLSITNDQIGLTDRWSFDLNYAYRIKFKNESVLSLGIRGNISYMTIRWDNAKLTQVFDQSVPGAVSSKVLPNFGAGAFYQARNWYVGFSMPRLFRNRIDFNNNANSTLEPELHQHYFLMGGVSFKIAKNVEIQPNILFKYVPNTPFDADINLSFVFFEKLLVGITYRVGDSIDGLVQWRIAPQFTISFAYDFTLTQLQQYNAGSIDVMLEYCFFKKAKRLHNPRFF